MGTREIAGRGTCSGDRARHNSLDLLSRLTGRDLKDVGRQPRYQSRRWSEDPSISREQDIGCANGDIGGVTPGPNTRPALRHQLSRLRTPADRGALVALRKLNGFDIVLRKISGLFSERRLRLLFLASAVKTGDTQFKDLHHYVRDAAYVLDLPEVPELYVVQDPQPGLMAVGSDRPFVVMTSGMFDLLDPAERRFVIGHEVGHILSGHAGYRTLLLGLTRLAAPGRLGTARLSGPAGHRDRPGGVVPQVRAVL